LPAKKTPRFFRDTALSFFAGKLRSHTTATPRHTAGAALN